VISGAATMLSKAKAAIDVNAIVLLLESRKFIDIYQKLTCINDEPPTVKDSI